jgi:hypothetical protein
MGTSEEQRHASEQHPQAASGSPWPLLGSYTLYLDQLPLFSSLHLATQVTRLKRSL